VALFFWLIFVQTKTINMFTPTHYVSHSYRDRWSELPEGQNDLEANEKVILISVPAIGSITVEKENGERKSIAGFSGYILKKL